MTDSYSILIIEDEKNILDFMARTLRSNGYKTITSETGQSGLSIINSHCPDLILLDLGLPDMDGNDIISSVRKWTSCPIIVISARAGEQDKVAALDLGADDYLAKPFHLAELHARVKSVIRRHQTDGNTEIEIENLTVRPDDHTVFINGEELKLNRKEFDLLYYFVTNPNRLINKTTLAEAVWGDNIDQADSLDFIYSQVKNLRKKMKIAEAIPEIKAVYGFGYKLITTPEALNSSTTR